MNKLLPADVTLTCSVKPGELPLIEGDKDKLRQVFYNLVREHSTATELRCVSAARSRATLVDGLGGVNSEESLQWKPLGARGEQSKKPTGQPTRMEHELRRFSECVLRGS